jgi:putative transcriptional regulator
MNVRHPVPDELLLDYTVGSTGPGKSLLVATHLAMCESSQERYVMLQEVGGALLESLDGCRLERISVDAVLARADAVAGDDPSTTPAAAKTKLPVPSGPLGGKLEGIELPSPLLPLAHQVQGASAWRRLGAGVEAAVLPASTAQAKVQLLRAKPGVRIVEHTHLGEELVLILKGAFWDDGEYYGPGDVAVMDSATIHAPVIDDACECLCLAVTEGPIRFVGRYGWLLNMFNRF